MGKYINGKYYPVTSRSVIIDYVEANVFASEFDKAIRKMKQAVSKIDNNIFLCNLEINGTILFKSDLNKISDIIDECKENLNSLVDPIETDISTIYNKQLSQYETYKSALAQSQKNKNT